MDFMRRPARRLIRRIQRNGMEMWFILGLLVNACVIGCALSGLSANTPEASSSSVTKNALAEFGQGTRPCVTTQRYFLYTFLLSKTSSKAISIFQDNEENSCFEGKFGTLMVELKEPILLQAVEFEFNTKAGKSKPKEIIIYGSEDRLGDSTMIDIKIGKDVTKKRFPYEVISDIVKASPCNNTRWKQAAGEIHENRRAGQLGSTNNYYPEYLHSWTENLKALLYVPQYSFFKCEKSLSTCLKSCRKYVSI